jgi:hypothetical protein
VGVDLRKLAPVFINIAYERISRDIFLASRVTQKFRIIIYSNIMFKV